jgi:hypothetical protein
MRRRLGAGRRCRECACIAAGAVKGDGFTSGGSVSASQSAALADFLEVLVVGGRTRARTLDPLIKSQLLYQLSYAPVKMDRVFCLIA